MRSLKSDRPMGGMTRRIKTVALSGVAFSGVALSGGLEPGLFGPGMAVAQTVPSSQSPAVLAPVTVTAQKRTEDAAAVPISMDVRSGDRLEEQRILQTPDLLRSSPNAHMNGGATGAAYTPYMAIRGVGSDLNDAEASIGMFVDGVPVSDTQSYTSGLLDMERVEILRGPQGTLYGRNTLGGSVNLVSRKADPTRTEGRMTAGYGSFGQIRLEGMVNAPVVPGTSAVRLAISQDRSDGYTDNRAAGTKNANARTATQARGSVTAEVNDSTRLMLSVDGQTQTFRDGVSQTLASFRAGDDGVSVDNPFHGEMKSLGGRAELTHDLAGGYTLTSLTGLRRQDTDYAGRSAPTSYFAPTNAQMQAFGVTGYDHRFNNPFEGSFSQMTQELRLTSPETGPLRYVLGAYGEVSRSERTYGAESSWQNNAVLSGTGVSLSMDGTTDTRAAAVFGDGSYALTEAWDVFGGLRVGYEEKDYQYRLGSTNASYTALMLNTVARAYDDSLSATYATPKAGLRYHLDDDNSVFGSVSQGYKSGGFNNGLIYPSSPSEFAEERLTNYEVGMKNSLFGGRLRLDSALFYIDWKDQQVLAFDSAAQSTSTVNASRSRSYGGELSGEVQLGDGWRAALGVGYADATYVDFKNAPATGGTGSRDASGKQQQYHSKLTGTAELGYDWSLGVGDLTGSAALGYRYRSKSYFDVNNTIAQDGYGVVDARIGVENDHYGVHLWGRNLTDERYIVSGADLGNGVLVSQGEPLAVGISGTVRF
ncbi:TonB-dependent receptor [Novispirillum itersonii]|uniref:Iron complex outermembrane receptor protein n=1 Tax=Novispirillum itersonii TaxID=189 RepID=A0A7X0DNC4_NOVIT|nr:TonB-dependent receptor [Novispirillum itersonii]MBB6211219.1 iron complex outermembrane receptor protein [Novispirillum itersonii]